MRPYRTASAKRSSPAKPAAISQTRPGMKIIASAEKTRTAVNSPAKASRAKPCGSSPASSLRLNIGTKAVLNAPSAKKRRNMLGSDSATRNASATGPVPSHAAIRMSRTKPLTRETMVQLPTCMKPRIRVGVCIESSAGRLRASSSQKPRPG